MFFYTPSTPSPPPSQPPLLQHQTQWQVLDERLIDEKNNEGFEVPQCLPCACDVCMCMQCWLYACISVSACMHCTQIPVCVYAMHSDACMRVSQCVPCLCDAVYMQCTQMPVCNALRCLYAMHSDACMQCTHMPVCNALTCLCAMHVDACMQCT